MTTCSNASWAFTPPSSSLQSSRDPCPLSGVSDSPWVAQRGQAGPFQPLRCVESRRGWRRAKAEQLLSAGLKEGLWQHREPGQRCSLTSLPVGVRAAEATTWTAVTCTTDTALHPRAHASVKACQRGFPLKSAVTHHTEVEDHGYSTSFNNPTLTPRLTQHHHWVAM